ncbi:MAG: helix-turn-helix transcriptional regulator [Bacillota bacterium]
MKRVNLRKIKSLRKQRKLTQKYMAKLLGYETDVGYHYLETGRRQIRAEQLAIIASELGVSVEDLYNHDTAETVAINKTG